LQHNSLWIRSRTCAYTILQTIRALASIKICTSRSFELLQLATVRTMWIPVWTRSSIRQVSHSKSRRPDTSLKGPDARASDMKIACIRSTVWTTIPLVWTREALVWKLRAAEVRPSERQGITVRMQLKSGKNFNEIFGKPIAQLSVRTPYDYCLDDA